MPYISRNLDNVARQAARHFPAVVVTGPRRAGKTTLLRRLFPKAQFFLLEDPDFQARVRSDPRAFLEALRPPVVFDEIQNTPELLAYVRTVIDTGRRRSTSTPGFSLPGSPNRISFIEWISFMPFDERATAV